MTTKYVSTLRGNDSTGDGSAATPWATIGKAIGGSPAFTLDSANPNFLYIEPGIYRESVTLGVSPTSSGPLSILGDYDGGGFAGGGYATPAAGLVEWRAWSDDSTPISGDNLAVASGKSYVTVGRIKFIGGNHSVAVVSFDQSHDISVHDCIFVTHYATGKGSSLLVSTAPGTTLNLAVDRCEFAALIANCAGVTIDVALHSSGWSLGSTVTNCMFRGLSTGIYVTTHGSGTFYATGLAIQNCTFTGMQYGLYVYYGSGALSPTFTVNDCLFLASAAFANAASQVTENGNVFLYPSSNTNISAGANSVFAACPALDYGDGRITGVPLKPFGTPSKTSTFVGFGSYGSPPAVDITGRSRPEGTGSTAPAVGCLERHDTGTKDTTYQDTGSSACMALIGPSSQERLILVDAVSTTLSVKVRWDGNHGDTNKPQAILVAEPQIGVSGQTVTATSSGGTGSTPNSYETLTFSAFTPTAKGAVTLRMVSRAAAGNGTAYFDSISL